MHSTGGGRFCGLSLAVLASLPLLGSTPWTDAPPQTGSGPQNETRPLESPLAQDAPELARLLRTRHVAPFWLNGEAAFARVEADLLRTARDGGTDERILTQMLRLIAAVGDGHTTMASADRYTRFGIAPFFAELHDDGVFLARVPKPQARTLGAELLAVDGTSIDEVLGRLRSVVPHSNDSRFRRWGRSYLHLPGLLHALGLTDSAERVRLTLRLRDGDVVDETFTRHDDEAYDALEMVSIERPPSLRWKNPDANYWFEALPDRNAVYFAFRRVASAREGESIWEFGVRLRDHLRDNAVERLIIDLRENGGGGYQFAAHLRPLLQSVPSLDRRGGVVVLTGPKTFSAASDFLAQIQRFTDATLIGLPPGSRVGEPGDDDDFQLPGSGVTVRVSQKIGLDASAFDGRSRVDVDVRVPERFADIMAGADPALDAALAYRPPTVPSVKPASDWTGRYRFRPDADLVVRQVAGRWRATLLPEADTPLTPVGPRRFRAALPGLVLMLDTRRDGVRLIRADGSERFCERKPADEPSAWELVFQGKVAEAIPLLEQALQEDPASPALADGAFPAHAIHLLYTLRYRIGTDEARALARRLLEASIAMHPEGAPDSTFSLRFYPAPAE